MKKPLHNPGDRVILIGWQVEYPSTVIAATEGPCTRIRRDIDGSEMLVSNNIIRPEEEVAPHHTDRPAP